MAIDIREVKKEYLRRILDVSLNNKKYNTVVFRASFCLDDIKEIILELKDEYDIDNIVFIDFDNDKIKNFFASNPTEEEIERFIPKFPKEPGNLKMIFFNNAITDLSTNYYSDYSKRYHQCLKKYNEEFYEVIKNVTRDDKTVTACPNKEWAEGLFGREDKLDELWLRVSKTLLSSTEARKELEERVERKNELNRMGIRHLYFYTTLGTDFKISLNPHSIWVCEPNDIRGDFNFYNYPSYEIYTSPNCYSAEGKIVLSKQRRFYYDILLENATIEFEKGRIISSQSNSVDFDKIVKNKKNKMNRIGEIALVSQESPIAQTGYYYDSTLFDENAGCHFALGYSLEPCIGVDKELIKEKGARYYRYNTSKFHTDLVFGDDSISVEAETRGRKKILLMENGRFK